MTHTYADDASDQAAHRIFGTDGSDYLEGTRDADLIKGLQKGDHIDLSAVDADSHLDGDQAFVRVAAVSHAAGELTVSYDTASKVTTVAGDVDGDGVGDLVIHLQDDQTAFTGFVL